MRGIIRPWLGLAFAALTSLPVLAQTTGAPPPTPAAPTGPTAPAAPIPRPTGVAATVNGQPIEEAAVQRWLRGVAAAKQAEARAETIDFLVENQLVDQYLLQLNIAIDPKDIANQLEEVKKDIQKQGKMVDKVLQALLLTEEELKSQIAAELRWEKFAEQQCTEKVLKEFLEANKEIFDGSMVRARHILLANIGKEPNGTEQQKAQLLLLRKGLEDQVNRELAKLPQGTDNLTREQTRTKLMDEAFAAAATKQSACPSKDQGGDVGWFPRAGGMVEPFARAAFALKMYQMSEVVTTPYGYHLILATEKKAGKETKFEEVKEEVKAVYSDRLRESLVSRLKPAAKVVIHPAPK